VLLPPARFAAPLLLLLLLSAAALPAVASADPLDPDFNDPRRCAACHEAIFDQWEGSMHGQAATDPVFRKFYEMVSEEVPAAVGFCMKCHSPVGVLRGQVPPATGEKLDNVALKGIFCDFCHTVTPTGIGNSAFETTFSTTKQGPFPDARSPVHLTKTIDTVRRSEFCGMCHNVTHPVSGRPIERTYQEWRDSPYFTGDPETSTHCQDCHMRQLPGSPATGSTERRDNPGKAASMGPERPHVWTHYFVGGDALFPAETNAARRQDMAVERLKNAATLEITPEEAPKGSGGAMAAFRVRVYNTGAGHKLPTGLSEVREMWLDVRAVDASGKELFRSGAIGKNGALDPTAAIFKTFLGIGKTTARMSCCFFAIGERNRLLSAERTTRDRRILPKGYDEEKYAFPVPKGARLPLRIEATLNYRSMSQDFANLFFPDGSMTVPVIPMASADFSWSPAPGRKGR
jgi:hypothetical protein